MAFDYASFQSLAKTLIEANGRAVTLRKSSAVAFDPTKPWRGSADPATEDSPGTADQDDFGYTEKNEDATLLKRGMKRCLVAETSLSPAGTDISRFETLKDNTNDEVYSIVEVKVLEPGPSRILYDIIVSQ